MGRFASTVTLFLLVVVLSTTTPAKAIDCASVISNIFRCSDFLKNPFSPLPGSGCCNAATKLTDLRDIDNLCKCIQPLVSQFLPQKALQLPGLCNINPANVPLVQCLGSTIGPLPPLVPLPPLPLVPPVADEESKNVALSGADGSDGLLPPFPPLPNIPLPRPLPNIPLPPLPNIPLPPHLPNIPLPPLPNIPLPPFPWFPLPPLPFTPPVKA